MAEVEGELAAGEGTCGGGGERAAAGVLLVRELAGLWGVGGGLEGCGWSSRARAGEGALLVDGRDLRGCAARVPVTP